MVTLIPRFYAEYVLWPACQVWAHTRSARTQHSHPCLTCSRNLLCMRYLWERQGQGAACLTTDTTVRRHLDDSTQFIQRHVVFSCCFFCFFFTLEPVAIVGVPWVEFFPLVWTQNSYCIRKWQQSLQDLIKVPKYITYIYMVSITVL